MIKEKHAGGRPSKTASINIDQLKFLVEKGFTDSEICQFFNISIKTFWNMKHQRPELLQALKDWKKFADGAVERSLFERAKGYSHESEEIFCAFGKVTRVKTIKHYPPDPVACFFWLKNRQPDQWRDKQPEQQDEELKETELDFTEVPRKNGKLPETMSRFLN